MAIITTASSTLDSLAIAPAQALEHSTLLSRISKWPSTSMASPSRKRLPPLHKLLPWELKLNKNKTQTQPRNTKLVKTLIQAKVTAQLNRSRASKGGRGASHHRGTSLKAKSTPAPSPTLKPALKMSKKPKKTRATNRQVQFSTTK